MEIKLPSPQLMTTVNAVAESLTSMPQPEEFDLASLKELLGVYGVKQRGWKLLIDYWDELLGTLQVTGLTRPGHPFGSLENLCFVLRLLQDCDIDAAPPRSLIQAWVALMARDRSRQLDWMDIPADLFRASWKETMRLQSQPAKLSAFLDRSLPEAVNWFFLTSQGQAMNNGELRRGWHFLRSEYMEWQARCKHSYAHTRDWDAFIPGYVAKGILVVELNSAAQIREEGEIMRHCVANVIDDCRAGNCRVFSLRAADTQERLATLGLTLANGEWEIEDLRMQDNEDPGNELEQVADEVLALVLQKAVEMWNRRQGAHLRRLHQLYRRAMTEGHTSFVMASDWVRNENQDEDAPIPTLGELQAAYFSALDEDSPDTPALKQDACRFETMSQLVRSMDQIGQVSLFDEA